MRRVLGRAAFVALLAVFSAALLAVAQSGKGVVEGTVVNGTYGGAPAKSLPVSLLTYMDGAATGPLDSITDAEGRFRFALVPSSVRAEYQVRLEYQGAEYASQRTSFAEGEASLRIEMVVYESTDSDAAIKVARAHTIIYPHDWGLVVKEYQLLVNASNRTYVGAGEVNPDGKRETLRFPLPPGAAEIQYDLGGDECCLVEKENGLALTGPVLPGMREVAYQYRVNTATQPYVFAKQLPYPTENYDLLVEGEASKVAGAALVAEEPVTVSGTVFQRLVGANLTPGLLEVQLSGPGRGKGGVGDRFLWAAGGVAVVAGSLALAYVVLRRRPRPLDAGAEEDRQRLLLEMARLDDDFQDGVLSEESYRPQREEKKARLLEIMRRSGRK